MGDAAGPYRGGPNVVANESGPTIVTRVALIGEQWVSAYPGGGTRYLAGLHAGLIDAGVDATAFVLGEPSADLPPGVVPVAPLAASAAARLSAMRRSVRAAGPFDVVDVHFAAFAAGVVAAPRPSRTVVHFHGPWAAESAAEGRGTATVAVRKALERFVYRRADSFVTLSEAFAQELVEGYGVHRDRVHVIGPGVDTEQFIPGDKRVGRARLGIDVGAFVVVCVRRLVHRMGLESLLDAWPAVLAARPGSELVIVGEGPLGQELHEQAVRSGVPVRFTGRVSDDELVSWLHAADLTVVPSLSLEGFGLVVLESLACGRPVLVTDCGGLPEAVAGLGDDLVVPAGDHSALSTRLVAVATGAIPLPSAGQCRAMAERAEWDTAVARHLPLYIAGDRASR